MQKSKHITHTDWDAAAAWDLGKAGRDAPPYLLDAPPYRLRVPVERTCGRRGQGRGDHPPPRAERREGPREGLRRRRVNAREERGGRDPDEPWAWSVGAAVAASPVRWMGGCERAAPGVSPCLSVALSPCGVRVRAGLPGCGRVAPRGWPGEEGCWGI
jgi:hypothetical protein